MLQVASAADMPAGRPRRFVTTKSADQRRVTRRQDLSGTQWVRQSFTRVTTMSLIEIAANFSHLSCILCHTKHSRFISGINACLNINRFRCFWYIKWKFDVEVFGHSVCWWRLWALHKQLNRSLRTRAANERLLSLNDTGLRSDVASRYHYFSSL